MGNVIFLKMASRSMRELHYLVSHDDYSVKIEVEAHPLFLIRLEPDPRTPVITDFHPGGLDDMAMSTALSIGLRAARAARPEILLFRDVMAGALCAQNHAALLAVRARIYRSVEILAAEQGRPIERIAFGESQRKIDIIVSFEKPA